MCDCNTSSFFPYRKGTIHSNFTDNELRLQCASENGLNVNDPANQYIIDACVKSKKDKPTVNEQGQQVVGYIQQGANIFQQLANIGNNLFGNNPPPTDPNYNPDGNDSPKGMGIGGVILIIAGVALLGGLGYMAYKNSKGGK